ncbi:hypothetical protein N9893_01020, partial [bacterium]|nr:hypothetical protein [bacterium]
WIKRFKADGYFEGKYISPEYYFYKKCAFGKYWDLEMRRRGDICWVCHRHFTELKPFGGPGDPMVGDFRGVYILQIYRPFAPYDEEAEIALAEAEENFKINGFKTMEDYMISRYGKRQTEDYFDYVEASGIKEKSLECRDCICLDSVEYHKKRKQSEATLSLD